jgi:hypothetical protein
MAALAGKLLLRNCVGTGRAHRQFLTGVAVLATLLRRQRWQCWLRLATLGNARWRHKIRLRARIKGV